MTVEASRGRVPRPLGRQAFTATGAAIGSTLTLLIFGLAAPATIQVIPATAVDIVAYGQDQPLAGVVLGVVMLLGGLAGAGLARIIWAASPLQKRGGTEGRLFPAISIAFLVAVVATPLLASFLPSATGFWSGDPDVAFLAVRSPADAAAWGVLFVSINALTFVALRALGRNTLT
jgi:hypothetical protein